jgi:hypothetical protein
MSMLSGFFLRRMASIKVGYLSDVGRRKRSRELILTHLSMAAYFRFPTVTKYFAWVHGLWPGDFGCALCQQHSAH